MKSELHDFMAIYHPPLPLRLQYLFQVTHFHRQYGQFVYTYTWSKGLRNKKTWCTGERPCTDTAAWRSNTSSRSHSETHHLFSYASANVGDSAKNLTGSWLKSVIALSLTEWLRWRPAQSIPSRRIVGDQVNHLTQTCNSPHCSQICPPTSVTTSNHPQNRPNVDVCIFSTKKELKKLETTFNI